MFAAFDAFVADLTRSHDRFRHDVDRLVGSTPVSPDRSHSVVALVWYPGQRTPIHDHVSWCVVGVYEGSEAQTLYHLAEDASGLCLVEMGRETAGPGSCSSLVPPAENIHRVANAGAERAISIHVYGAGIERLGSSINTTFDHLPIREDEGATQQTWRSR